MEKTLYRSRTDKFLGGVCGGLAKYLGAPSWLVRVVTVILIFFPIPVLLVIAVYALLWITVPEEPDRKNPTDPNAIDAEFEIKN